MIREATTQDIPRLIEMGRQFLLSGPYKDVIEDHPETPRQLAEKLLGLPESAKVIVAENRGAISGVLAFIVYPHFYSGRPTAQEIIWLTDPEERKKFPFDGIALFSYAQKVAKEMGAEYMQFTAPTHEVAQLYELKGYTQIEVGYQKRL